MTRLLTHKGVTLLEVLIATVIFTVGIVTVLSAFNTGMFASTEVENVDLALNLAQERMESIRDIGYGFAGDAKGPVSGFPAFQRQAAVTVLQTDLKQVDVTVYWQTRGGETNIALTTYLTNY